MTNDSELPPLTDEARALLAHERFIAEVLKARKPDSSPKPAWQRFLETTGGAALITVLLGGLLGQTVSCSIQQRAKEHESDLIERRARSDRAFLVAKEMAAARIQAVERSLNGVSAMLAAARDLITLTSGEWSLASLSTDKGREKLAAQKEGIRDHYNKVDAEWRASVRATGFTLAYYHGGSPSITASWEQTTEAVGRYVNCARGWRAPAGGGSAASEAERACAAESEAVEKSLGELVKLLRESAADDPLSGVVDQGGGRHRGASSDSSHRASAQPDSDRDYARYRCTRLRQCTIMDRLAEPEANSRSCERGVTLFRISRTAKSS